MSYQNQPHLNGAYYGPAIPPPPPPKYSHRPRSSGRGCCARCGCCLFDCVADCGCCLLGCVFKIIYSIFVVIGLVFLAAYLLILPRAPKFYATNASLNAFNYSSNQLSYDFNVNLTVRNPNKRLGYYYDTFEANAFFENQRFETVMVDPFFQGTKTTTELDLIVFKGQKYFPLGSKESSEYEGQMTVGRFNIILRVHLRTRVKLGLFKFKWETRVRCDMNVPLNSSSSSVSKFETKKCSLY